MPKAHFDEQAVCQAARETPSGIHVSTNHPAGFRRVLYKWMREHLAPDQKLSILQSPASPNRFMLVPTRTYEEAMSNAEG